MDVSQHPDESRCLSHTPAPPESWAELMANAAGREESICEIGEFHAQLHQAPRNAIFTAMLLPSAPPPHTPTSCPITVVARGRAAVMLREKSFFCDNHCLHPVDFISHHYAYMMSRLIGSGRLSLTTFHISWQQIIWFTYIVSRPFLTCTWMHTCAI